MFTRYNGIRVPSNYGGTRFIDNDIDSNVKIHKGKQGPEKISVSQSFQQSQNVIENEEIIDTPPNISVQDEEISPVSEENYIDEKAPLQDKEADKNISAFKEIKSSFDRLFNNLAKDDLLLIGLILLLSDNGGKDNFSVILMLSLLLLSK
ncbi:MAG: hypothetical protein IJA82_00330 [Clostridia bacterium]|nr:hypothetical protein [Clostridia bacterium]